MKYLFEQKKWNGWGDANKRYSMENLPEDFSKILCDLLEIQKISTTASIRWEDIYIPDTRLSNGEIKELQAITSAKRTSLEKADRLMHSRGRSLPDLISLRSGKISEFPDAVMYPDSEKEVLAILDFASKKKMAVIPYGGGSSVVGGINSFKLKSHKGILVLNMQRMNRLINLDEISLVATFECGILGPDLEQTLNDAGYTLGHFPQSFEFSTLGGWLAARGAGYFSGAYGKAETMLISCKLATPAGIFETKMVPAASEGADFNQVIAGSEGSLGVITRASVKIQPLKNNLFYRALLFSDYETGVRALMSLKKNDIRLHMARLSDSQETRYFSLMSKSSGEKQKGVFSFLQKNILQYLGYRQPALMLTIGEPNQYDLIKKYNLLKETRHISLGKKPVADWFLNRYELPYLRDELLNIGIAVDTFETSVLWSGLAQLRFEVYSAIQKLQEKQTIKYLLMSHISHSYQTGAAIYFTIIYPMASEPMEQWNIMKRTVTESILKCAGSLSHHHGIGMDHLSWFSDVEANTRHGILQNIKKKLDPEKIMNPGKLI